MRLTVPLGPFIRILEAKIGCQIDHPHSGLKQGGHMLHGNTIRGREKDHITLGQAGLVRLTKSQFHMPAQIGKHIRHCQSCLGTGGNGTEFHFRMGGQET